MAVQAVNAREIPLDEQVQLYLGREWARIKDPFPGIKPMDLMWGVRCFQNLVKPDWNLSLYVEPLRRIIRGGYPFATHHGQDIEQAMDGSLTLFGWRTLLFFLMMKGTWSESMVCSLPIHEICRTCCDFANTPDGPQLLLLRLIQIATDWNFDIPADPSAKEVLTRELKKPDIQVAFPWKLVQILFARANSNEYLYEICTDKDVEEVLIRMLDRQLQEVPVSRWPSKIAFVASIAKNFAPRMGRPLVLCDDPDSKRVGALLTTIVHQNRVRVIQKAVDTLVDSYSFEPEDLWSPPPPFLAPREDFDLPNVQRMPSGEGSVFISGPLMIRCVSDLNQHYLVTYNMETKEAVWVFDAFRDGMEVQQVDENTLALHFEERLMLLDAQSGDTLGSLEMEEAPLSLHVSPDLTVYRLINERVDVSRWDLEQQKLVPIAQHDIVTKHYNKLLGLSSHCGYYIAANHFVIFDPRGQMLHLPSTADIALKGDKLYTLSDDEKQTMLAVRSLADLTIESKLVINAVDYRFGKILDEGWVVLFQGIYRFPTFVDIAAQKVRIHKVELIDNKPYIHPKTGAVYDLEGGKRYTPNGLVRFVSRDITSILHIDEENRWYVI
jgi:hypothetical protein